MEEKEVKIEKAEEKKSIRDCLYGKMDYTVDQVDRFIKVAMIFLVIALVFSVLTAK